MTRPQHLDLSSKLTHLAFHPRSLPTENPQTSHVAPARDQTGHGDQYHYAHHHDDSAAADDHDDLHDHAAADHDDHVLHDNDQLHFDLHFEHDLHNNALLYPPLPHHDGHHRLGHRTAHRAHPRGHRGEAEPHRPPPR